MYEDTSRVIDLIILENSTKCSCGWDTVPLKSLAVEDRCSLQSTRHFETSPLGFNHEITL